MVTLGGEQVRDERRGREGVEVEVLYIIVRFCDWLIEILPFGIGASVFIINN